MAFNVVSEIDDRIPISNVLISVSDKTNLSVIANGLLEVNPKVTFYSTGGTFEALRRLLGEAASAHLVSVSDYTGQPEMQGGLVKTLDFKIYLGLLSETYNEAHQADLRRTQAVSIDMVVVNLYPFRETVATPGISLEQARGNIDIGGPCMCRAAAKNFIRVAGLCRPESYAEVVDELRRHSGTLSLETRFRLAKQCFAHTAAYDSAVSRYLETLSSESLHAPYSEHPFAAAHSH